MKSFFCKLYRLFFCRGGYGVHSPFVFDLITKVIEERTPFYCYETLRSVRIQLLQKDQHLLFSKSEDELLFRLANRFHPKRILAIGSDIGLLPLYLSAYSKSAHCVTLEQNHVVADFANKMIKKYANSTVEIHCGEFVDLFSETLKKPVNSHLDFVVWAYRGVEFTMTFFEQLLPHFTDDSVLIIAGINETSATAKTWKTICKHPKTTVTVDLVNIGIVFFNSKLNKKTYKSVVI